MQDVHDNAWNCFLRERVADAFGEALRRRPELFHGTEVAALMPSTAYVHGFWAPLVRAYYDYVYGIAMPISDYCCMEDYGKDMSVHAAAAAAAASAAAAAAAAAAA